MKSRIDLIWDYLQPTVEQRSVEDAAETMRMFHSMRTDIIARFIATLDACNIKALAWQESGDKGETTYVSLSFLYSSVITKNYDIRIDFYDDMFEGDIAESCSYFSYAHLMPIYNKTVDNLCKLAEKEFIRLMPYEKDGIAWQYVDMLYKMVLTTTSLTLGSEEVQAHWKKISRTDGAIVTFGELYNNQEFYFKIPFKEKQEGW